MGSQDSQAVLIVEDDVFIRGLYEAHLREAGYDVRMAGDGEQALQEMQASTPALVLLDLVMPGLGGYDVLERMREMPALADVAVVVFSSQDSAESVERAMELGATDYLVKTVTSPKQVAEKVSQVLRTATAPDVMLVAIREAELDAATLAEVAVGARDLSCEACAGQLAVELHRRREDSDWFDARLVCPACRE
jgi:DNA-binding response OmpR family regulator